MPEKKQYEDFINKALDYESNGQWSDALVLYDEMINLYPGMPDLYYKRAHTRYRLANYQGALEDFNTILDMDPSYNKAYYSRGIVLGFCFADYEKGIADLQKAAGTLPDPAIAHFYTGILYFYKKDYKNAESAYNKILTLYPTHGEAYFYRAILFDETGDALKALADYSKALENGFRGSEVFYHRGMVYAKFRNFNRAKEDFADSWSALPGREACTQEGPCCYYTDGRQAVTENIFPDPEKSAHLDYYLEKGFVRYSNYYFRHNCKSCKACIPLRVLVNDFVVTKSIKRTLKMNSDLQIIVPAAPVIDSVRIALFEKYYKDKHNKSNREKLEQDVALRHFGFKYSREIDFYLGTALVAVAIVDEGSDALYASYIYYDTRYMKRRLGILCVVKAIEFARELGKTFYYMGWYLEDIQAMSYKKQFRPNQLLIDGQWQDAHP